MYLSFKRPIKLKKYFLHCTLKILLVKEENKYVSSTSLKTPSKSNPKDCSDSRIRIYIPGFILSHWSIFPSAHVIAGFQPQAAI
jgi:hypothetical protein